MMRSVIYPHARLSSGGTYLHVQLLVLLILALLPEESWLTNAWNSLPDPASFPESLRAIYTDVSGRIKCDFNEGHSCEFTLGRGWSFQQSFQEFTLKVQKAAAAAADATQRGTNDSRLRTIPLPEPNYFLCSVVSPGTGMHSLSPLQVHIPWPRFVPFAIPLTGTDTPKQKETDVSRNSTPSNGRQHYSGEILSHTVQVQDSFPIACMQLGLRFPATGAAQVNLSFDSLVQSVNLDSESTNCKGRSIRFTQKCKARSIDVPRNVWLLLTVPLFAYQASEQEIETFDHGNRSLLFVSRGLTWMAVLKQITVSLRASSDVCVDNFVLYPTALPSGFNGTANPQTCFRGLTWRDSRTGMNHTILLDSFGADATKKRPDLSQGTWEDRKKLLLSENNTFIGQSGWFRFTGALILAICATFLFLLFTATLCISIALTRRRKSPSRLPLTPTRTVHSGSRNHVFRPPDYAEDSLLPRIRKLKPEEETQSSETEPVSTENSESLFQNDVTTCQSLIPEDGEIETMDPKATSAMQFARNWFLYRNRGDRLRQRPNMRHLNVVPHSLAPCPPSSPPIISSPSPYAFLQRPVHKASIPLFAEHQVPQDLKTVNQPTLNLRHSLVLTVDEQDQLVILPTAQSITNSMHRTNALETDNCIHEVEENNDDIDADARCSERSDIPVMNQRSRMRTDGSSQSDIFQRPHHSRRY